MNSRTRILFFMLKRLTIRQLILLSTALFLMAFLVFGIGYRTDRTAFLTFFLQYVSLFILFYMVWLNQWNFNFYFFLLLALGLRLVLLGAIPELSNDFYRFIWDGELITQGKNPFAQKPEEIISNYAVYGSDYKRMLYLGMGSLSQEHYSCYPVLNQVLFAIPAFFSETIMGNIFGLRIIVILADLGAIYFAKKIANHFNLSIHAIWLYFLNPFVILEFTGNLHFEGVMVFFLLAAIYFILKFNWILAGVFFALAIHIKLIPLMLLPFVLKKLKWRFSIGFLAVVTLVLMVVGGMMLNVQYLANMLDSVNEYFVRFQFNASVFYIIREIGFATVGWDPIQFVGPILSLLAGTGILILAAFKAYHNDLDMVKGMLFGLMIYYFLATTVHPWYVGTVLALSMFTQYKFALVWSLVVMLSYSGYMNPTMVVEKPYLLIAEYLVVIMIMFYEIRKHTDKKNFGLQLKSFFGSL
ncbi:glycosyltransferase family 87 protein [Crocinitomix algicola]|uniref:glycosyltransferase family 87 protein n=1 Tax=Crocinitomix algicola TaxID=1740263 RepID=UPI001112D45D|nr:glycosyltransferase family 87 protein [Crocinitomix algicola]